MGKYRFAVGDRVEAFMRARPGDPERFCPGTIVATDYSEAGDNPYWRPGSTVPYQIELDDPEAGLIYAAKDTDDCVKLLHAQPRPAEQRPAEPGDAGELTGLNGRPDLNGRSVEVEARVAGKDGAPRVAVRLRGGAGAGTVVRVKPANLQLVPARPLAAAPAARAPAPAEERKYLIVTPAAGPEGWRDWAAGLPDAVLLKVARKVVAQTDEAWAAFLRSPGKGPENEGLTEQQIRDEYAWRKPRGLPLFPFAMVCRNWRRTQLRAGRMCTWLDHLLQPGRVPLLKWALAEGLPRAGGGTAAAFFTVAGGAAAHGKAELVKWLVQDQEMEMDAKLLRHAAASGNLALVQWLVRGGCPWDTWCCYKAASNGHGAVLQWLRQEGCPWDHQTGECIGRLRGAGKDKGKVAD